MPGGAPPRLSFGKSLLFSLVAVLLVLLVVEGSVRLYLGVRGLGVREEPRGYVMDDPDAGYTLKPGFSGGGLRINSLGFRGPEIAREKPAGTYRIVALGDSATFGPHEQECAYPHLLPPLLAPRQVEVVNAAIEGYRSDRALAHLQKYVLPLRPDLVTVFIGWNDLYQTDPREDAEQPSIRGNPLARLLTLSEAAQTFRRLYFLRFNTQRAGSTTGPRIADPSLLGSYRPGGYAERLRAIFRTARASGAEVVAFTWPTLLAERLSEEALAKAHYPWYTNQPAELRALYARYQETLREVGSAEGVPVLDAAALFDARGDKAPLFQDTAHFTCEGHAMIAEHLARHLRAGSR